MRSIDQAALPCQVVLRLSIDKRDLAVEEITYQRRPTDPRITHASITAAPVHAMVELVTRAEPAATHRGAQIALLRLVGIEWSPDKRDPKDLIESTGRECDTESDEVGASRSRVIAHHRVKLRRHVRSRRVKRRKIDRRRLAKVARVYTDALAEGKNPSRKWPDRWTSIGI